MQRIAASVGATQKRTARRGPNKTPDFVARDTNGVWHVIECKGTQSGIDFSNRQLGEPGPPATGGVAQKRSIVFPRNYTGQRLACGLAIGLEGGDESRLTIIDPEPEDPLRIRTDQIDLANDAATRGVMSKALRLAGFEVTAESTALPFGRSPDAARFASKDLEAERLEKVKDRDRRVRDELDPGDRRSTIFGGSFRGRERIIYLPRPVVIGDVEVTRAIVRQGVNRQILAQMRAQPTVEELIDGAGIGWAEELGRNAIKGEARAATMTIGAIFRSELILE
jgi:hypothetical protein